MVDEKLKVKIIGKETGNFPSPSIRKIYPNRTLLWKYYFITLLGWIIIGILVFSFINLIIYLDGLSTTRDFPLGLRDIAWILYLTSFIGIILPTLILLPIYVKNMEFIVHGDFVCVKKGIINRTTKFCPFRTITNISTRVGPFDRIFGFGNVFVETAGKSGQQTGPKEKLEGLSLYHEIRDYILQQLRIYNTGYPKPKAQNDLHFDRETLYNEYLTELRDINQILEKKQGENNE